MRVSFHTIGGQMTLFLFGVWVIGSVLLFLISRLLPFSRYRARYPTAFFGLVVKA